MNGVNTNSIFFDSIAYLEDKNYVSYDQFDVMMSPLINKLTSGSDLARRIAIQINKNIPFNIRSLLGYQPMMHTKTISDMLTVYSNQYAITKDEQWRIRAKKMYDLLMDRALSLDGNIGWGLNFPYTTRFTNAQIDTPNLYNTLNSIQSLIDYYVVFEYNDVPKIIRSVVRFMFEYLGIVDIDNETSWFRYYPNQKIPNINVNATSTSFFVRVNIVLKESIIADSVIYRLLNFLVKNQNGDGSWYYALSENGKWIDGYHTGFVLDALLYLDNEGYDYPFNTALEKGLQYYLNNLFTVDGIPKFFNNNLYPIEAQNCAQAIQT